MGTKISDLAAETSIQDTDEVIIRRGANNYKAQVQHLPPAQPDTQFSKFKRTYYVSTDSGITDHSNSAQSGSLADVITNEVAGSPADIVLPGNKTYVLSNNLTIPSNVRLMPQMSALLSPATTKTLTINGFLSAGPRQVFTGAGDISFGAKIIESYAEWWGIDGTSDQTEINKALAAGSRVRLLARTYSINGSIQYQSDNVLIGCGIATIISANLSSDSLLESINTANRYYRVYLGHFKLDNTAKTNAGAIGIDLTCITLAVLDRLFITNIETGIRAQTTAYYNEIQFCEIKDTDTGISLLSGANDNRVWGGKVDSDEVGIDIDGTSNVQINGTSIENFDEGTAQTGIRIANTTATTFTKIIGPRLECLPTVGTGISISSNGQATALLYPYFTGLTTNISDSAADTQVLQDNYYNPRLLAEILKFGTGYGTHHALLKSSADGLFLRDPTDVSYEDLHVSMLRAFDKIRLENETNAQSLTINQLTTEKTGLSGATTTWVAAIPSGYLVLGVSARVTTIITGATSWDLGDGADIDKWGASLGLAAGTTVDGTDYTAEAETGLSLINSYAGGADIVLTANGANFTGGAVRLTAYIIQLTAPTS